MDPSRRAAAASGRRILRTVKTARQAWDIFPGSPTAIVWAAQAVGGKMSFALPGPPYNLRAVAEGQWATT
jgi:hypothetical protein